LAESGFRVAAAIQPDTGRRSDGGALGFELELIEGTRGALKAERLPLARAISPDEAEGSSGRSPALAMGRFVFEAESFGRAEALIGRAIAGEGAAEGTAAVEVIGLDEIGRLELAGERGLASALSLALDAVAGVLGLAEPRLLAVAARDSFVAELVELVAARGLATRIFSPDQRGEALETAVGILRLSCRDRNLQSKSPWLIL